MCCDFTRVWPAAENPHYCPEVHNSYMFSVTLDILIGLWYEIALEGTSLAEYHIYLLDQPISIPCNLAGSGRALQKWDTEQVCLGRGC